MSELEQLRRRVNALEAAREVSACLHEYMQLCDYLDEGFDLEPLVALFTADAIWEGRGQRYAATFGRREGREAVRAMFEQYTRPPAHFALNVHFLTSEKVDVESENDAAGTWVLLQTATFADGRSQLSSALLDVRFRREGGKWKIAHFCTTSRFNRPVHTPWDNPQPLPVPEEE
ncbi:nuclear transport factor 2 family protein [Marinobacterium marinum]|uniref:Nuclear transport factor 2 family protein n=1 Tax=Marinobacterium marinum TaxID=2756129 RepID=A0A7W1WWN9_9GAMM|nr:nuclear transport factor 2 family protein [Marinobacterium marinum]MBA4501572.1 nuclear transport factor 2 family protein [Marinobacterium marinum]